MPITLPGIRGVLGLNLSDEIIMDFIPKPTKLDERYAPPLNSEHVTLGKLKRLKAALWVAYAGLPLSLFGFLLMLILDDNHSVAENVPIALSIVVAFFVAIGAFVYVAFSPIYRRLMNRVLRLDEGEIYLQHQAYSFAYGVLFKVGALVMILSVITQFLFTSSWTSLNFPQIDGGGVFLASILTALFMMLLIMMLPMIYLVGNLKPVGEED